MGLKMTQLYTRQPRKENRRRAHRPSDDLRHRQREARRARINAPVFRLLSYVRANGGDVLLDAPARADLRRRFNVTRDALDAAIAVAHGRRLIRVDLIGVNVRVRLAGGEGSR